jgi:peptidoglycan biosynthesis protein MviN/MurJ (putative lipid II flippase)
MPTENKMSDYRWGLFASMLLTIPLYINGECLSDPTLDAIFAHDINNVSAIPRQGKIG